MTTLTEQVYLDLFFQLQKLQWQNYAEGAAHDLNEVNEAIFTLLDDSRGTEPTQSRPATVWQAIVSRGRVDNHPKVAALRNRLDNWDNYADGILPIADSKAARLALAKNMRADVIELLALRQHLARQQGFASYVDLVLAGEDLSLDMILSLIDDYLQDHLAAARELVQKYQISWTNWFTDLDAMSSTIGAYPPTEELVASLLRALGLAAIQDKLSIVSRKEGFTGYTGVLSPGKDVRILVRESNSIRDLLTLGHELGHALAHLCNANSGLYLTWTGSFDESMAITIEQIAAQLWLSPEQRKLARAIWTLEGVRCSLSFLFELALWRCPTQAEANYYRYYGLLGIDLGDPAIWPLDSFRSLDPIYIHNYVLGDIIAQRTLSYLQSQFAANYSAWGRWLTKHYFALGREQSLAEKIAPVF